ncbi:hypothetical protein C4J81_03985 [Deltaproteobacteria bacterium Smac51]|nr:hypothetical protein C4J81_03985 [Deltaproteobacteria bacterium Smac51]
MAPLDTSTPILAILGNIIYFACNIYVWVIIARVLLTWINPNPYSPVMRFLSKMVDPLLNRARKIIPFTLGGIDFSPILVIIGVGLGGYVVGKGLILIGYGAPVTVLLPLLAMAVVSFMDSIAWILIIAMIARLVMSLVNPAPYNPLVLIVYGLTEPLLAPLRGFFPRGPGGLDFRALVFLLVVILAQQVLLKSLYALVGSWIGRSVAQMGGYGF